MTEISQRPWWKDAIFYQIYPRSFQDSNGDGIGDLGGITSRLDEVAALGVDAIWLSPIYCSPDADNGYDIADYCSVDPRYGTLADFDQLVAAAKKRGIRIIMDLVINHTSDEHPWFQASRAKITPYTDYYIWRPAKPGPRQGERRPPNNWTGFFLGSAWTWDETRQQYYLHLFDRKQPDLNYDNPIVLNEIKSILRFWLERGVAGFRCDVISLLSKSSLDDGRGKLPILRGLEHYKAQSGTHAILRELRRSVLDPYGAFTVGETVMVTLDEAHDLSDRARGELDLVFYFDHLEVDRLFARYGPKPFRADVLLHRLATWQRRLEWNAIYLENHDQPRIVSHYGDDQVFWSRSARLLAILLLTLRGTAFIYQGQELGMTNADFESIDEVDDVESKNMDALLAKALIPRRLRWWLLRPSSRDNARTPYQWSGGVGAGFTTGISWLGINSNSAWLNYERENADPRSVLNFYRRLISFKKRHPTLREGVFEPVFSDRHIMAYRRVAVAGSGDGNYLVILNFSSQVRPAPAVGPGRCVVSNTGRKALAGHLLPWEAIVVREADGRKDG